jgi:hypothetical protein
VTGIVLSYILFTKYDAWIRPYILILLHICRHILNGRLNHVSRSGSEDVNHNITPVMGGGLRWISSTLLNI